MKDFLPISKDDLKKRGWDALDVILVTGDAYVDHPSYGAALIGRILESAGYKAGIIAQPDWRKKDDFMKLGAPRLFFGVTSGNLDSMVANYTAAKKPRKADDYSPGGLPRQRPDRSVIVYTSRIKESFPDSPVVIGGIEASLRRLAHYDFWQDKVRRSALLDSKADILVYGMGERQILEIAGRLRDGENINKLDGIKGTVVVRNTLDGIKDYISIPSFEEVSENKDKFNEAFRVVYLEADPFRGKTIIQKSLGRFVIQFPPAIPFTPEELDRIYLFDYERRPHFIYDKSGGVPGFETVRNSIISHRGCSGACSFCSLYFHQGRIIQSRSASSMIEEVKRLTKDKDFKGTITDIGGPTANLYAAYCSLWKKAGACRDKECLMPKMCRNLKLGYKETVELWNKVMEIPAVKHLFIGSGLRYDLLVGGESEEYLTALAKKHISGRLKVAPEHTQGQVLKLMNKPPIDIYNKFVERFNRINKTLGKKQYLVNYFISAHPGATLEDAKKEAEYLKKRKMHPEQVQDFIPLPMTCSASMYYTGKDPLKGGEVFVAKSYKDREIQRALIQYKNPKSRKLIFPPEADPPSAEKTCKRKIRH